MGNCEYSPAVLQNEYDEKLWEPVIYQENYCILRSVFNDLVEIQKWTVIGHENQDIYGWRNKQKFNCLPPILLFKQPEKGSMEVQKHMAYTQVVDPLQKFSGFRPEHYAIILRNIFQALTILVDKFGMFQISERNVFVDRNGQISVWINSNLASNHVQNYIIQNIKEEDYVQKIIQIIQARAINSQKFSNINLKLKIKEALYYFQGYLDKYFPSLGRKIRNIKQFRTKQRKWKQQANRGATKNVYLCQSKTTGTNGTNGTMYHFFHGAQFHQISKSDVDPDKLLYDLIKSENIRF